MVDQTVANLKITADSSDLTKVNAQLDETAAKTDVFNSKLGSMATAAQPASTATQKIATDLNALGGEVTKTSGVFGNLLGTIKDFGSGLSGSLFSMQTWRDTWAQMTPAASSLASSTKVATAAVATHAVETRGANEATKLFTESIHGARPALQALGVSIGSTRELIMLLHGGLVLLAGAMGAAFAVEFAKAQDELQATTLALNAFTGNLDKTKDIIDAFGKASVKGGADVATMSDAFTQLIQFAPQTAAVFSRIESAVVGVSAATQKMSLDAETATKVQAAFANVLSGTGEWIDGYGQKIKTVGAVSVSALESITKASPAMGQALAGALRITSDGAKTATQVMIEYARNGLISSDSLIRAMQNLANYTQQGEGSISLSWSKIKNAWKEFQEAIGKDIGIKSVMDAIADSITRISEEIKHGSTLWEAIGDEWTHHWKDALSEMSVVAKEKFDEFSNYLINTIIPGMASALQNMFQNWFNSTFIGKLGGMLNSAIDTATQAVGANVGNPLAGTSGPSLGQQAGLDSLNKFDTALGTTATDVDATATATGQLNTGLGATKDATDKLTKSATDAAAPAGVLADSTDKLSTAAQSAGPAADTAATGVTSLSSALASLGPAIQAALAAVTSAAASAGSDQNIQLPPSATGNLLQVGGSGPDDSLTVTGKVSPGETIAILPPGSASGDLLSRIQGAIGGSPISVSSTGSSPTSISAMAAPSATIGAPTSYAAYESAMSRYGTPALAPGGHVATAAPVAVGAASAVSTARSAGTAPSAAQRSPSATAAPSNMTTVTIDGVAYPVTTAQAAVYAAQQPAAGQSAAGGTGNALFPGLGPGKFNADVAGALDKQSQDIVSALDKMGGGGGGGGASAAAATSRVASAAAARKASEPATKYEEPFTSLPGSPSQVSPGAAPYGAPSAVSPFAQWPGMPAYNPLLDTSHQTTINAPEPGTGGGPQTNPYFGGGYGGIPIPPEAPGYTAPPGYTQAESTDAAGNITYTETGTAGSLYDPSDMGGDSGYLSTGTNVADYGTYYPPEGTQSSFPDYGSSAGSSSYDPSTGDEGGGSIDTSAYDSYGGLGSDVGFAAGGGFSVPYGAGASGSDTVGVRLKASGGERIRVDRPGDAYQDDAKIGRPTDTKQYGDVHVHISAMDMAGAAQTFSRTAVRRLVGNMLP